MTIDTEAPVRVRTDEPAPVADPEDLGRRRRAAVAQAVAQADPAASGHHRAAVGVRRYAPGSVALALRGRFDRVGRERLRALLALAAIGMLLTPVALSGLVSGVLVIVAASESIWLRRQE